MTAEQNASREPQTPNGEPEKNDAKPAEACDPATPPPATAESPPVPIQVPPPNVPPHNGPAPPPFLKKNGTPAAYSRFEMRLYGDTEGRRFTMLVNRDGHPVSFRASVLVEKAWPDGVGGRQTVDFDIPALHVDEAFDKYDEAKAAAVNAGMDDLDHKHLAAALGNRLPGPPTGVPLPMPGRRDKRKRLIH
jgi:hypothetical protein